LITRDYRSLTETEIKSLRANHQWLRFKLSDLLGVTFFTLVLYVGGGWCLGKALDWLVFTIISNNEGRQFFAVGFPVVGLFLAAVSLIRGEKSRRKGLEIAEQSFQRSLSDGRAEIVRCDVTRAAELDEYEDEGPGFFLEIAPNLLLFLQGQYLMDYDCFPSTSVTVTRVAQTHQVLDVQYSGDRVVPCRRIESTQFGGTSWLENGLIFHGQIDEIPEVIGDWPPKTDALDESLGTEA